MLSLQLAQPDKPVLTSSDTFEHAFDLFEELDTHNLPVIEPTTFKLVGYVNKEELEAWEGDADSLSDFPLNEPAKVYDRQHVFEAARLMLQHEFRVIPVVDHQLTYLGLICKRQVLESLSDMLNLSEHGSVITVEMVERDYTLSEIVQLIEVEGAKILGLAVETPDSDQTRFRVSVKLNLEDSTRVSAALRRYGYTISSETVNESAQYDLEERADELLKYLEI